MTLLDGQGLTSVRSPLMVLRGLECCCSLHEGAKNIMRFARAPSVLTRSEDTPKHPKARWLAYPVKAGCKRPFNSKTVVGDGGVVKSSGRRLLLIGRG